MGLKRKQPHPSSSFLSPELPVSSQRSEDEVPGHGSVEGEEEGESEEDMYEDIVRVFQDMERNSVWLNTPSALVDEEKPKTQSPQVDADDASDHSSAEEDERKESEPSMNPYEQWSRYLIELNSPGVASVKRESSACEPISIYSDKTPKPLDLLWRALPRFPAPPVVSMKSDSFLYPASFNFLERPPSFPSPPPSVCSVKSDSSMYHPPCFSPLKLPSALSPSPSVCSMKSDSSMFHPPSFHLATKQSAPSPSPSVCSMKSDSSMFHPPSFHLVTKQSAPSPSPSVSSMKSDSSMFEPPSFHPQKTKRRKTDADGLLDLFLKAQSREAALRSCSMCEKDLRDPVKLPCGHQSCKHCAISYQRGSPPGYSCKKCGKKFKRDSEQQTDTEDDAENLNTPSTPSGASDDTLTESSDQDLQSVLLQKKITRVEMETEKLRVEKEKLELEKTKLALEIRLLQQRAGGKI